MTFTEGTLPVFTFVNGVRFLAYVAKAISFAKRARFLGSQWPMRS